MELTTGRQGKPHITSQQDRQKHQGIFGDGAYILNTGNMLEPEVQSSNKIHIKDGALMFQGALFTVKVGTYDEVTINNGNQGMKRKDLIVARYTYDSASNIEAGEWAVIQGTPAADNPVVPETTSGDIQAGDSVVECPVFVVNLDGINVTGVDIIPETMRDMSAINADLSDLIGKLDGIGESAEVGKYGEWSISTSDYYAIGNKLPTIDNDYYKTVSTGSSITVKKSGVYIITFESNCIISSDNGTIWARLTLNGHEIKNIQNNGGNGYNSVTYTEVLRLNENDAINAFLSASGTVRSIGNDSLNITRISA